MQLNSERLAENSIPRNTATATRTHYLVVDACILRSAGPSDAVHPVASTCRETLKTILQEKHYVVISNQIRDEWRRHQGNFAVRWRVDMLARRRFVQSNSSLPDLWKAISKQLPEQEKRNAAQKDFHLIEAAKEYSSLILSSDGKAREIYAICASTLREIGAVAWTCPTRDHEAVLKFLRSEIRVLRVWKLDHTR